MPDVRSIVRENLRNALEGGYEELRDMTAEEVAWDMIFYAADCEAYLPKDLIPHIEEFFRLAPRAPHTVH